MIGRIIQLGMSSEIDGINLKELANYEDIGKEFANKVLQIKK